LLCAHNALLGGELCHWLFRTPVPRTSLQRAQ
jgi:hypothetical protein